ncbi:MAG: site-specific DNA-methyltransferase [Nitrososphaerota archaeon]|nr:site-specific DNA-methyltransferase [Nitrososphaerota archaeon]
MRNHEPKTAEYLVRKTAPYYHTVKGAAYLGDALQLLETVRDETIDLIVTSPPFALVFQKRYKLAPDFVDAQHYLDWFMPIAREFHRVLKKDGSLVLHLGGSWNPAYPTKSLYNFEVLTELCKNDYFSLAQDFYWFNPAKMPSPIEWTNVRRIRVKDAVEPIWWLSKDSKGRTKARNTRVLIEYTKSMLKLLERGSYSSGQRPSGYNISRAGFLHKNRGAIPPNLVPYPNMLPFSNTESNGAYLSNCKKYDMVHPARFPIMVPEFFIRFLTTRKSQVVLDAFAGSNSTGYAAEKLGRKWLAFEKSEEYLKGSMFRFFGPREVEKMWSKDRVRSGA